MILTFKDKFKNGNPTNFAQKIWSANIFSDEDYAIFNQIRKITGFNPKIHTIREDKTNRWKAGMKIQATYNGRYEKKRYFAPVFECKGTQTFEMSNFGLSIKIDGKLIALGEIEKLAINDGFESVNDFLDFFNTDFSGKIIHFTNFRY